MNITRQQSLESLDWDDENPINDTDTSIEEWIKLEIGDMLIGVYVDKFKDKQFKKIKYCFSNVVITRAKTLKKEHYNKIGFNNTGNLSFTLDNEELLGTPLKIIREQDIPIPGKPKPAHHFKIIKPRNNGDI